MRIMLLHATEQGRQNQNHAAEQHRDESLVSEMTINYNQESHIYARSCKHQERVALPKAVTGKTGYDDVASRSDPDISDMKKQLVRPLVYIRDLGWILSSTMIQCCG
jgi:hypothetical protein